MRVDRRRCIGAGRCEAIAPRTFRLDARGRSRVLDPRGDPPETVRWAARACPVGAVLLQEGRPAVDRPRRRS